MEEEESSFDSSSNDNIIVIITFLNRQHQPIRLNMALHTAFSELYSRIAQTIRFYETDIILTYENSIINRDARPSQLGMKGIAVVKCSVNQAATELRNDSMYLKLVFSSRISQQQRISFARDAAFSVLYRSLSILNRIPERTFTLTMVRGSRVLEYDATPDSFEMEIDEIIYMDMVNH